MKKYKWNKKKCFKNILKLLFYTILMIVGSITFTLVLLGFCGIDYVL